MHKGKRPDVEVARQAVHDATAELLAYYSNDEQVLDSLVYATPGFAVNLDAKLAALAVQKGGAKKKFVVAALGSSVTAGHDGFGDTAWPAVLQRRLAKALAPFGIEVEVRNQAVGGSEPFPRSLCMSTLAGDDADLVIREWEYWGYADGAIMAPVGGEEGAIEAFVRNALALPSAPAVLFLQLDAGGKSQKTPRLAKLFGPAGKIGKAYGPHHAIGVLSGFGPTFDHMRSTMQHTRTFRTGEKSCTGMNIGDCPVGPKPDGYHDRPLYLGVAEDDPLVKFAGVAGQHGIAKLYINWHPGTIGHEVMGHQASFVVLSTLHRGLAALGLSTEKTLFKKSPLPSPVACAASPVCQKPVRCALASWPKAPTGIDVGDWVDNSTATTRWGNRPTPKDGSKTATCAEQPPRACQGAPPRGGPESQGCFSWKRSCSYHDMKRAFVGGRDDGDLVLRPPPGTCTLFLSEPGYEWSKPVDMANWHAELDVRIDGEPCRGCTVKQAPGAYLQNLLVDVRKHRGGGGGSCDGARVSIAVKPVETLSAWEADTDKKLCGVARNGRCEVTGDWRRYQIDCQPDEANGGVKAKACHVKPGTKGLQRDPAKVAAYVTGVLAW